MRLVFLGSGQFGLPTLRMLHDRHELAMVVTQPDRPAGRKRRRTATPIGQWAADHDLPCMKEESVNTADAIERVKTLGADAAVVIAFGQKLSPQFIEALGPLVINLHASLLPRYRGAGPINWAVINGEKETGNSVIALAERMDAGVVYAQNRTEIDPLETAGELHDRLSTMGPEVIGQVLADHAAGQLEPWEQDEAQATRAPKLKREDAQIDFAQPATSLRCRIHGLTPWPGVHVTWRTQDGQLHDVALRRVADEPKFTTDAAPGTVLDDLRVATGQGTLRLLEVQPAGKRVMPASDFAHGHNLQPGDELVGR